MDVVPSLQVRRRSARTRAPRGETTDGEPTNFEDIYRSQANLIYAYVLARVRSPDDAADLTQQVFLKAWRAYPGYRDCGVPIRCWLLRIASNIVTDFYRRNRDRVDLPWDLLPASCVPLDVAHPEDDAVRQEEVRYLLELVHQLPSEKQELIALRFAGGLKVREIARVLDRSESAVKTELSRTLHYLKERYDESQR